MPTLLDTIKNTLKDLRKQAGLFLSEVWAYIKSPTLPSLPKFIQNGFNNLKSSRENSLLKNQFKKQFEAAKNKNKSFDKIVDTEGNTPLMQMVKAGNLKMVEWLLREYPSKDIPSVLSIQTKPFKLSPLIYAAQHININALDPNKTINKTNIESEKIFLSLLTASAYLYNKDLMRICMQEDNNGYTFLDYFNKNYENFSANTQYEIRPYMDDILKRYFAEYPGRMDKVDPEGYTPIIHMIKQGNLELIEWMIKTDPEILLVETPYGTPIKIAEDILAKNPNDKKYRVILNMLQNALPTSTSSPSAVVESNVKKEPAKTHSTHNFNDYSTDNSNKEVLWSSLMASDRARATSHAQAVKADAIKPTRPSTDSNTDSTHASDKSHKPEKP